MLALCISGAALVISLASLGLAVRGERRARDNRALINMLMALREYDADQASGNAAQGLFASHRLTSLSIGLASRRAIRPAGTWVLRAASGFRSPPSEIEKSSRWRDA